MGVNPTQPNYKSFTFDGTNSRAYGVYITGQGVFNAPLRNVEMVEIPGRDGAYALDKGNFNNIEVTYPAGIFADNETDFATAVSNLRNFLCSKVGYVRLEDDYNPNEYRMAVYKSGLDVTHDMLIAGEFEITFECKPQRWLTSGETKTTLTSGNTITNPTLFQSSPLLETYGYGDIDIGDQVVTVNSVPIGDVVLSSPKSDKSYTRIITIDDSVLDSGDTITVNGIVNTGTYSTRSTATIIGISFSLVTNCTYSTANAWQVIQVVSGPMTFQKGTSSTQTASVHIYVHYTEGGNEYSQGYTLSFSVAYDGINKFTITTPYTGPMNPYSSYSLENSIPSIMGFSTKSALGNPLYIDLDIGEAYNLDSGTAVSVNDAVTLPAELPTLPSGSTTITFDNTFTKVDIVPRWWKV